MRILATITLLLILTGCAGLGRHDSSGFTCMASADECARYLRTGSTSIPAREPSYRIPDQDFTVIHSNRGPTTIYRQGNTYWVNSKVKGASGPPYLPAYGELNEGLTVIHSNRGPTTIYRKGNTYWVDEGRRPSP